MLFPTLVYISVYNTWRAVYNTDPLELWEKVGTPLLVFHAFNWISGVITGVMSYATAVMSYYNWSRGLTTYEAIKKNLRQPGPISLRLFIDTVFGRRVHYSNSSFSVDVEEHADKLV